MVIASGFLEANELKDVERIVSELEARGIEVNDSNGEKIVFLIERDTMAQVRTEVDSLKDITGVRNVHLAYYSLEGAVEGPDYLI